MIYCNNNSKTKQIVGQRRRNPKSKKQNKRVMGQRRGTHDQKSIKKTTQQRQWDTEEGIMNQKIKIKLCVGRRRENH